jgi:hypothetical protein
MGEGAEPFIITIENALDDTNEQVAVAAAAAEALGAIGPKAKGSLAALEKLRGRLDNDFTRQKVRDAIKRIDEKSGKD